MDVNDFARAWGAQRCVHRIDRKAIPRQLLREDRVGHPLEWIDHSG
jgi:hypothetical protein